MADITKCIGTNCPLKSSCYRYLATDSVYQSYADFATEFNKKLYRNKDYICDNYWYLNENK